MFEKIINGRLCFWAIIPQGKLYALVLQMLLWGFGTRSRENVSILYKVLIDIVNCGTHVLNTQVKCMKGLHKFCSFLVYLENLYCRISISYRRYNVPWLQQWFYHNHFWLNWFKCSYCQYPHRKGASIFPSISNVIL